MIPQDFKEANVTYGAPHDLDSSQCFAIKAYHSEVKSGTLDGSYVVVTCWKPSDKELEVLKNGGSVFLSTIGGLPPHFISTSFQEAILV